MTRAALPRPRLAALAAAVGAILLTSCGAGAGARQRGTALRVTDNFGATQLLNTASPKTGGGDTVMRLLQRNAKVATAYGGGFVEKIDGLGGGSDARGAYDWFFYVNGLQADRGGAQWRLRAGEQVWWDRRHWGAVPSVDAVVGSFPAPLVGGVNGAHATVDLRCATSGAACDAVRAELTKIGARTATAAQRALPPTRPDAPIRVVVGTWAQARALAPELGRLAQTPADSGVFARFSANGGSLTSFDGDAKPVRTDGPGTGLVAALRDGDRAPVWAILGTDGAGVQRAAAALTAQSLNGRFAVELTAAGSARLPVIGSAG